MFLFKKISLTFLISILLLLSSYLYSEESEKNKNWMDNCNYIKKPNIGGVLPISVAFSEKFNPLSGVLAYDYKDGYLNDISVTGKVDTNKPGNYLLKYSVVNSSGTKKTVSRNITVLPKGEFATIKTTGRLGPHKIVEITKDLQGKLLDDFTFIKPVVYALPNTKYCYKLIERNWDSSSYKKEPPTEKEWQGVNEERFYKDLYLTIKPRVDRWLRIDLYNNGKHKSYIYALKGDKGVKFYSEYLKKEFYHLSKKVDDPETSAEQFKIYSQSSSYWAPIPFYIEKMMGGRAHIRTIADSTKAPAIADEAELHGFYITIRSFMKGVDKRSQSDENWKKIADQWNYVFSMSQNSSFRRSFQVPTAEMNGGKVKDFIRQFTKYYIYLRKNYNPERIIVGTSLKGRPEHYINFFDLNNPYFMASWHKGRFGKMYEKFISERKLLGCIIQYPRINEVWRKREAFELFEAHRLIHKHAKENFVEAAILDKIGILGKTKEGEWSTFALPYYAMWFCYDGYDYLNNSVYFKDDWDGDGLSNEKEHQLGTNPFSPDTDGDLIFDGLECKYGLNPLDKSDADKDFDNDKINNFDEIIAASFTTGAVAGTEAHNALTIRNPDGMLETMSVNDPKDAEWDPDNDLLPAWFEIKAGLDPTLPVSLKNGSKNFIKQPDVNKDFAGMISNFAYHYGIDRNVNDFDQDGVSNIEELINGSDPTKTSNNIRMKEWSILGHKLFKKYFDYSQYQKKFYKGRGRIDSIFSYSTTENALTAEVHIDALSCDSLSLKPTIDKIEVILPKLIMVLNELKKYPKLWADKEKIIVGASIRTYLNRKSAPNFRQDRGIYSIYIPIDVYKDDHFVLRINNILKKLSIKSQENAGKSKGTIVHEFIEEPDALKCLFYNSLEQGYKGKFKADVRGRKVFTGDCFDYNIYIDTLSSLLNNNLED